MTKYNSQNVKLREIFIFTQKQWSASIREGASIRINTVFTQVNELWLIEKFFCVQLGNLQQLRNLGQKYSNKRLFVEPTWLDFASSPTRLITLISHCHKVTKLLSHVSKSWKFRIFFGRIRVDLTESLRLRYDAWSHSRKSGYRSHFKTRSWGRRNRSHARGPSIWVGMDPQTLLIVLTFYSRLR